MIRALLPASVLFVTLAGCNTTQPVQRTNLLLEGENAFRAGQYDVAADRLSKYLSAQPAGTDADRARYVRGMALARTNRRSAGYTDLTQAARTADSEVSWRAQAVLGVLYFEDERWPDAARNFDRAISTMPAAQPQDALLFRFGLCLERLGRWSDALRAYDRLARTFSQGPYGDDARRRLALRPDHFAVQCGVFRQPKNAESFADELRRAGLNAYLQSEPRGSETLNVVLSGRYDSYEQAVGALARVRGHVPQAVLWP